MSQARHPKRLHVSGLSDEVRMDDMHNIYGRYGRVVDVCLKRGFAFVEFETRGQALDAIEATDNLPVFGRPIRVDFANDRRGFGAAGRVGPPGGGGHGMPPPRERGGRAPQGPKFPVLVEGIAPRTSWQDLKDFARSIAEPGFANVFSDAQGPFGIIEFRSMEDAADAVMRLNETEINGDRVTVRFEKSIREEGEAFVDRYMANPPPPPVDSAPAGDAYRERRSPPRASYDDRRHSRERSRSRSHGPARSRSRERDNDYQPITDAERATAAEKIAADAEPVPPQDQDVPPQDQDAPPQE
ncbi:serine-arginine protein 55 [Thecamonas trahens ATCC 50062]|uniref:Serine-arginine protein 55 n=1 Tax=Thecamonas trahens ATCC 50062 TaxID=461836 RepID=A0A0L0DSZ0_THETB|nr:serine-arginine protein 55 [Thecamonas trahens ATCC 50062]KNC55469.1 serine-arginine protein 55 [Thecamonas trahens ATCC 50062]|eukprot:XP_013761249.1 serine-arginine protein 55 [Thecamonas trahens ATCC 50062]